MIGNLISEAGNHLWQSTASACFIALLSLMLRGYSARARYWLWMTASLKFLLPLSLLFWAGSRLQPQFEKMMHSAAPAPIVSSVITQVAQPFSSFQAAPASEQSDQASVKMAAAAPDNKNLWMAGVAALWTLGFVTVIAVWVGRWLAVRSSLRRAIRVGITERIPIVESESMLEPGVFGILKPVLVMPKGINQRLTPEQMNAVLSHEISHVHRRDNLTASIHMFVEAVFWFHPLVWWIENQLVEERERACDEAVLESGNDAESYAEGILNVCRLYLETPLACVSGVTGADLKKRIMRIAACQTSRKLNLARKLVLASAGVMATVLPMSLGLMESGTMRAQATDQKSSQDLTGIWQGTLHAGRDLRTVLKVTKTPGGFAATLYSIDQGGQGIPATSITQQGAAVKWSATMIDGAYEGKMSADANDIEGTWKQGGGTFPLNLKRATPDTAWAIPEPPPRLPPMAPDAHPTFEVATIKPSKPDAQGRGYRVQGRRFSTMNTTLESLLTFAYSIHAKQIVGAPSWAGSEHWDIEAQPDGEGQPSDRQWKEMLQKLIADRFQLKFHLEKKDLSVYAIELAKSGPKLTKSQGNAAGLPGLFFRQLGVLTVTNATMNDFAGLMQNAVLDRPVVDQTGLDGRWDFTLKWTPDETQFSSMGVKVPPPSTASDAPPDLFTAVQDQIGLKLSATKAPVDVYTIDRAEKPSAN